MALSLSESDTNGDRCLLRTDPASPRRSAFPTVEPFLPLDWLIAGGFPLFGFLHVSLLVFVLARLCYSHETLRGVEVTTSLSNMATVTASLQFPLLSLLRAVIISGDVRSISFLRLVTVMVLVLTTVTTKHHLHLSLLSDPQSEAHPSHGDLLDSGFVDYVPALLAGCLVLLTFVSNVLVSGRHELLWAFRRLSQILLDLICNCRPERKPPWNYWAEMAFEKAMGMIPHLQEGVKRRHNTSNKISFLFQREADVLTTTSKSRQQLKVMLKAFWSLSYMLLAINIKYMKGGPISHSLIARKAYVQQAGLTHSIIEATASHICEKWLYPSSLSLLYERICVSNLVYLNDVLFCY